MERDVRLCLVNADAQRPWTQKPFSFFGAFLMSNGVGSKLTPCQMWVYQCQGEYLYLGDESINHQAASWFM